MEMSKNFKSFLDKILKSSQHNKKNVVSQSMQWYFNKVRILTNVDISNRRAYSTVVDIGKGGLFTYFYDPKYKETLPYFDKFPLIIPLEVKKDGWLGLNLHYMPPKIRAIVFDDIIKSSKSKKRIDLAYSWVKAYSKHPIIKHGIKRYLVTHVVSPIVKIDDEEWKNAILLPTQTFVKRSDAFVWSDYK